MPREFNTTPKCIKVTDLGENGFIVGFKRLYKNFPKEKVCLLEPRFRYDKAISRVLERCRNKPSNKYYFPKVYTGEGRRSVEEVALACVEGLWYDNVYLPEEFIDAIAHKAVTDDAWRSKINICDKRLADLEYWDTKRRIGKRYESCLSVLKDVTIRQELSKCIIDHQMGKNLDGQLMGTLCRCLEAARDYMIANGNIPEMSADSSTGSYLKEALKGKGDEHIGNFFYTIFGLASPGKHLKPANPNSIVYRKELHLGGAQRLAESLLYMLLDILEWCSRLPEGHLIVKDSDATAEKRTTRKKKRSQSH